MTAEQSTVHAGIGYQVELVCLVYSEPVADVIWYKDTMLLDHNERRYMQQKGNRFTLLIRQVQKEDFGNYSCAANNMLGRSRAFIRVRGKTCILCDVIKDVLLTLFFPGNPNTPVINNEPAGKSMTSYRLSWITESYSTIDEYRLLFRKLPVGVDLSL